jgi:diacylglycerol O-acyltransferase / wax synthase
MDQLAGQDAAFIYLENEVLKTHFTMLTIYDQSTAPGGNLRYRDVLRYFEDRILGMPVFRRKLHHVPLELDAPYFVDDSHFHIEAHVRHIALPAPGDWRQFCILAAQIHAQPIEMSKPLWDMTVIGGLDNVEGLPTGAFAILTRLHHAVADGTTARGILTALHYPAGQVPPPPPRQIYGKAAPSKIEMAARAISNNARQLAGIPPRLLSILPGAGPTLAGVARSAIEKAIGKGIAEEEIKTKAVVPATVFNGEMEYRRVFQMTRYPLASIKPIRTLADDATLNDAVLAIVGGGLKRFLAATGESDAGDLQALCPVNLRVDKFANESQLGNNISLMQINLGTSASTASKRLARIVESSQAAKLKQKASTAKEIIALSRSAPNLLLATGSRLAAAAAFRSGSAVRLANCIITNVPGPQEPLYFMGARLVAFSGIGPVASGAGPIFIVTSYMGQLTIGFTACPSWIKDPQLMIRCLDESHAELLETAAAKTKTTAKTTAKTPAKTSVKAPAQSAKKSPPKAARTSSTSKASKTIKIAKTAPVRKAK